MSSASRNQQSPNISRCSGRTDSRTCVSTVPGASIRLSQVVWRMLTSGWHRSDDSGNQSLQLSRRSWNAGQREEKKRQRNEKSTDRTRANDTPSPALRHRTTLQSSTCRGRSAKLAQSLAALCNCIPHTATSGKFNAKSNQRFPVAGEIPMHCSLRHILDWLLESNTRRSLATFHWRIVRSSIALRNHVGFAIAALVVRWISFAKCNCPVPYFAFAIIFLNLAAATRFLRLGPLLARDNHDWWNFRSAIWHINSIDKSTRPLPVVWVCGSDHFLVNRNLSKMVSDETIQFLR